MVSYTILKPHVTYVTLSIALNVQDNVSKHDLFVLIFMPARVVFFVFLFKEYVTQNRSSHKPYFHL